MADRMQSYKNHTRFLPAFHFFVAPVLLLNVLYTLRHVVLVPIRSNIWELIVALALLTLAFLSRLQALTVQDRVIRLEMRQRLMEVLPADMRARIGTLSPRHLVALRFASDAELPELVRDICEGRLQSTKDIKLKVKDWQADWLRA